MPLVCQKCSHESDWDSTTTLQNDKALPPSDAPPASQRAALIDIEVEIARFRTYAARYVSNLKTQRTEVEARLDAVVYPIISIPPEITSLIFVECLDLPSTDGTCPTSRAVPLLLMQVCRRWRDIALSTCELWSSLDIECDRMTAGKLLVPRRMMHGISTWLSRAQARPLSLAFQSYRLAQDADELEQRARDTTDEPLDISVFLPQLQRLDLQSVKFRQLIPSKTPLQLLQYLHAALRDEDLEDVLANAPLLAELSWSRVSDGDFDVRRVRSDTLTKLEVESFSFSVDEFISILQSFPSLSHLTCSVFLHYIPHRTPLLFPNLRSLDLRQPENISCHVVHALELLVLPRLTHLRSDSPSLSLHPDAIRRFISRSACLIRELKCVVEGEATRHIWNQLEMFTSLETLDITLYDYITPFFQELDTEPRPPKLPNLRHLTISYFTGKHPIDYTHVIDIVQRRRAHTETMDLKSVHLVVHETDYDWWDCYPHNLVSAEFLRLVARGVDITITSSDLAGNYEVVWPA